MEEWRQVVNYEYKPIEGYLISNQGRVYSHKTHKILKNRIDKKGYNNVCLNIQKFWKVSRLVALAFPEICGGYFEGAEVDHINGVRDDNRPENLKWVTHKDNINNPLTIDRFKKRKPNPHPKQIIVNGIVFNSQREAAKYFGVNEVYISAVKYGRITNARKLVIQQ